MASNLATIRRAIYDEVAARKAAQQFVDNTFDLAETWMPFQQLKDIPAGGKVWIIGLAGGDQNRESRGSLYTELFAVGVGYQVKVTDPTSVAELDPHVEFMEQLKKACREIDPTYYTWTHTEALKDENDVPYAFVGLRQATVFESYFTAYYQAAFNS